MYYRLFGADGVLSHELPPAATVLDVGCSDGRGSVVLTGASGCDIFRPNLSEAARLGRRRAVVQTDIRRLPYRTDAYDAVVALDVIEHFEKPDGCALLDAMEAVARRRVVVFTPNGFLPQGEKDDNPLQVHRSGWTVDEFTERGYAVTGINGWKPLRGELWEPRVKPPSVGHRLSACTQPLVTRYPRLAFQLLAVRDLPRGGKG
jgi:SAM-dependent methyltransferase